MPDARVPDKLDHFPIPTAVNPSGHAGMKATPTRGIDRRAVVGTSSAVRLVDRRANRRARADAGEACVRPFGFNQIRANATLIKPNRPILERSSVTLRIMKARTVPFGRRRISAIAEDQRLKPLIRRWTSWIAGIVRQHDLLGTGAIKSGPSARGRRHIRQR